MLVLVRPPLDLPQQGLNVPLQSGKVRCDDSRDRQRVDIAQVIVDEDVAKAADLPPGNVGAGGFLSIRKLLGCLGQV